MQNKYDLDHNNVITPLPQSKPIRPTHMPTKGYTLKGEPKDEGFGAAFAGFICFFLYTALIFGAGAFSGNYVTEKKYPQYDFLLANSELLSKIIQITGI